MQLKNTSVIVTIKRFGITRIVIQKRDGNL